MIRWWNNKSIPVADKLWKPGLHPISTKKLPTESWYNSSVQLHQNIQEYPYKKREPKEFNITRKIKLNPTKEQRTTLVQWWNAYRYTYNKTCEQIGNSCMNETRKISIHLDVSKDEIVKLDLGYRFELKRTWKLDIKYITEPKLKFKINVNKANTKITSTKITVLEDPVISPIRISYHFEYPKIESWYTLRDDLVTYKRYKSPKDVEEFKGLSKEQVKSANLKEFFKDKLWLLDVDKTIRAGAVKDARAACETICTLAKDYNKKGTLGPLPFKRKKYGDSWSISMEKTVLKPCVIEKTTVGRKHRKLDKSKQIQAFYLCPDKLKTPILCYEKIPKEFGDPKIHKDVWGDWWLLLPIKKQVKFKQTNRAGIALDPGIKTFLTGYTTNGKIYNYVEDSLFLNVKILMERLNR